MANIHRDTPPLNSRDFPTILRGIEESVNRLWKKLDKHEHTPLNRDKNRILKEITLEAVQHIYDRMNRYLKREQDALQTCNDARVDLQEKLKTTHEAWVEADKKIRGLAGTLAQLQKDYNILKNNCDNLGQALNGFQEQCRREKQAMQIEFDKREKTYNEQLTFLNNRARILANSADQWQDRYNNCERERQNLRGIMQTLTNEREILLAIQKHLCDSRILTIKQMSIE